MGLSATWVTLCCLWPFKSQTGSQEWLEVWVHNQTPTHYLSAYGSNHKAETVVMGGVPFNDSLGRQRCIRRKVTLHPSVKQRIPFVLQCISTLECTSSTVARYPRSCNRQVEIASQVKPIQLRLNALLLLPVITDHLSLPIKFSLGKASSRKSKAVKLVVTARIFKTLSTIRSPILTATLCLLQNTFRTKLESGQRPLHLRLSHGKHPMQCNSPTPK